MAKPLPIEKLDKDYLELKQLSELEGEFYYKINELVEAVTSIQNHFAGISKMVDSLTEIGIKAKKYDEMVDNAATLDHTIPLSVVLEHKKIGLEIMCRKCNFLKGDKL